jgi:hypothetical protein
MKNPTNGHPSDYQPLSANGTTDYLVVPNGRHWDVLRNRAFIGTVTRHASAAIELAITEARREHECGRAVNVSVDEKDGPRCHVWP